jgi:hypothetical protein
MPSLLTVHAAVTWALTGLIHTIQWVHYPLFKNVGPGDFPEFHRQHTTRITRLVAPLMLAEILTAGWLLLKTTANPTLFLASLPPLVLVWISTALLQVPLHNRLANGFNPAVHRRLVLTNHIRTFAWTLRALLLLPLDL